MKTYGDKATCKLAVLAFRKLCSSCTYEFETRKGEDRGFDPRANFMGIELILSEITPVPKLYRYSMVIKLDLDTGGPDRMASEGEDRVARQNPCREEGILDETMLQRRDRLG